MAEYIRREDVLERTYWEFDRDERRRYGIIYRDDVEGIRSADVAPVRRGKWMRGPKPAADGLYSVKCSICGHGAFSITNYVRYGSYCPFCGARMGGQALEEDRDDQHGQSGEDVPGMRRGHGRV